MTDRSFEPQNDRSRQSLADLIGGLDSAALATDTGEGWSVATVLAHLAFWDRHTTACFRCAGGGSTPSPWPDESSTLVNDAIEPVLQAVPAAVAASLALEAADEVDGILAALPDATVDAVRAEGRGWLVDAWEHRLEHIAQIEHGLGRG